MSTLQKPIPEKLSKCLLGCGQPPHPGRGCGGGGGNEENKDENEANDSKDKGTSEPVDLHTNEPTTLPLWVSTIKGDQQNKFAAEITAPALNASESQTNEATTTEAATTEAPGPSTSAGPKM